MLQAKDVELLLIHGALQVQYKKPKQAIMLLEALLEIEPQHKEARQTLAVACLDLGRYARSIELCESLLEANNSNEAGLWFCLSQARWKQDDVEGARRAHRCYIKSLNSEPNE
ncbi:type III secretion system chaperone VscY [Vibrio sp. 10N.222.54.F12]|jgi:type III secretion protein Y|uniref:Type III secretion system chaperone VscY n=3 Tax=Vibrio TaxID=662 RepID=A0ABV4KR92_9VIBR|nr:MULTISPECIES: type III secretion system chaperone VscY [Vibrio]OEF53440.1 translocation protein Y [Vibrio tasmaniensis 1F-267]OEF72361.1 translocation protein Y [Vibrio tasmaniensis 1F-187]OEF73742.1 translocation protein Y [Vibrio tasmaniensis 1F-155]PML15129.1 translocation protein Y [Vibrio tasmaniensis]PML45928.1 translocation protein Y [Vibrio tasmaniensis]